MTEHEFENTRAWLWHTLLKNGLLLPLAPREQDWSEFYKKAQAALKEESSLVWPAIDLRSDSAKKAADAWLNGSSVQRAGRTEFDKFFLDFNKVEYLRPRHGQMPNAETARSYVETCSNILRQAWDAKTPVTGATFWPAAFQLEEFMRRIEHGSDTFWDHFEQVF